MRLLVVGGFSSSDAFFIDSSIVRFCRVIPGKFCFRLIRETGEAVRAAHESDPTSQRRDVGHPAHHPRELLSLGPSSLLGAGLRSSAVE